MLIRLPFAGPYDWSLALRMIGAHAVPGAERLESDGHAYTRVLTAGAAPAAVTVRPERDAILAEVDGDDGGVAQRVAHWLDLTLDPAT